jgi:hypothetical protein
MFLLLLFAESTKKTIPYVIGIQLDAGGSQGGAAEMVQWRQQTCFEPG